MSRRRVRVIAEVAEDVATAVGAIAKLRSGRDGAAVAALSRALERELRRAAAAVINRRRRRRNPNGQFTK